MDGDLCLSNKKTLCTVHCAVFWHWKLARFSSFSLSKNDAFCFEQRAENIEKEKSASCVKVQKIQMTFLFSIWKESSFCLETNWNELDANSPCILWKSLLSAFHWNNSHDVSRVKRKFRLANTNFTFDSMMKCAFESINFDKIEKPLQKRLAHSDAHSIGVSTNFILSSNYKRTALTQVNQVKCRRTSINSFQRSNPL